MAAPAPETYAGLLRDARDWRDIANGARRVGNQLAAVVVVTTKDRRANDMQRAQADAVPLLMQLVGGAPVIPVLVSGDSLERVVANLELLTGDVLGVYVPAHVDGAMRRRAFQEAERVLPLRRRDDGALIECPAPEGHVVVGLRLCEQTPRRCVWQLPASPRTARTTE